jgi:hypothetical protein
MDEILPPLVLNYCPRVQFGSKVRWDIAEDDIVLEVGHVKYVQLRKTGVNYGFSRIVHASTGDNFDKKEWSLSKSNGYKELQTLRNEAQMAEFEASEKQKLPSWQQATAKVKATPRVTRTLIQQRRTEKSVIVVGVPGVNGKQPMDVEFLRPVCPGDELACKLCVDTLQHLVSFIVDSSFNNDLKRSSRQLDLPKGTKRQGGKYVVKVPDEFVGHVVARTGRKSRRTQLVDSLDQAMHVMEGTFVSAADEAEEADEADELSQADEAGALMPADEGGTASEPSDHAGAVHAF